MLRPSFVIVAALLASWSGVQPPSSQVPNAAQDMRREGALKPGDQAPDFNLPRQGSESRVRLSAFANRRPVALVFGSYT